LCFYRFYGFKKWGLVVRKSLVLLFFLASLLPAFSSQAVEVVALKSADIKPYNDALDGFRSSCGCSVREVDLSEVRAGSGSQAIFGSDPDMAFAVGLDALNRVRSVSDIPVVYTMVPPSQSPGAARKNISGVSMSLSPAKFIGAIQDIFPNARSIGIIYDPRYSENFVTEALRAAQSRGVELVLKKAGRPAEVPALIDSMRGKIDVFWMLPDMTVVNPETVKYLLLFSFQNKVPVFTFSEKYVELGALAALEIVPYDMGVQAGEIAKKLAGERSARGPVRLEARKTLLVINRKVARKLGIRISEEILGRARNVD
jgi:putative ABC transport system substrate-binding protein